MNLAQGAVANDVKILKTRHKITILMLFEMNELFVNKPATSNIGGQWKYGRYRSLPWCSGVLQLATSRPPPR